MNPRPTGVTIVGFLVLIGGVFAVVGGLLAIVTGAATDSGVTLVLPLVIVDLIIGIIYLAVARGIFSGSRVAQIVVGIVTALRLIADLIVAFIGGNPLGAVFGIAISIAILWILFGTKGREFFQPAL